MSLHETFNRSAFSQFINSRQGRVFRVVAGLGFIAAGSVYRKHPLGLAAMGWGVLPLTAGGFDVCYISGALGGPWSGQKIRRLTPRWDSDAAVPRGDEERPALRT